MLRDNALFMTRSPAMTSIINHFSQSWFLSSDINSIITAYLLLGAKGDWDFRISVLKKKKTLMDPVVNFGEVQRAQLTKSTLLTSTQVPLGSFQIF